MEIDSNQLFHLQILNAAEKYSNQIALVDGKTRESLTFGLFRKRAFQFATVLSAHMFPSSGNLIRDTVLVVMPNTISYPFVFCGSALLGNPICGINPSATKEELQNAAMKCGAQYIVCTAELLDGLLDAFDGTKMPIFVFGKHILNPHRSQPSQEIIDLNSEMEIAPFDEELVETLSARSRALVTCQDVLLAPLSKIIDLNSEMEIAPFDEELVETLSARSRALVTYQDVLLAPLSSGTMGEPKCIQLTHKNFNAATIALKDGNQNITVGYGMTEVVCLSHVTPLTNVSIFDDPNLGSCGKLIPGFEAMIVDPDTNDIKHAPNEAGELWLRSDCVMKGYLKNKDLTEKSFEEKCGNHNITVGYGMTEVVCLSHVTPLTNVSIFDDPNLGSCGKLIPGFEAMIVDPDTNDIKNGPNEAGELWLRSDCVMKGYLKNKDLTEKSFEEKWLKTGDIVFKNDQEYYFVIDRLKNMIKVNGMQVSPVEIEQLILTFPYVSEAAVIGIQDSDSGEVPLAFIVLKSELLNGKTQYEALEKIREFVHGKVASYKQLKGGLIAVEKIPKNSAGKASKKDLQALAIAEHETVL
uniref:Uncharacterized protein n=1 Tax=Panagrolaimus sp. ES5 TaxID=591445 RepID=A0AC34FR37_9BILA